MTTISTREDRVDQSEQEFGRVNPNAPAELSQFAFLIGRFRCEAKLLSPSGKWQTCRAEWAGRYILDGYAIADEYRMMDSAGQMLVLGANFRTYAPATKTWTIKWLNALDGTWWDLGPAELGGIQFDGQSIRYQFKEPLAEHTLTRVTYTNISPTQFTWRGEKSDDGKTWGEFMVIECERSNREGESS